MPFLNGLDAMREILKIRPGLPVIVASATKSDTDRSLRSEPGKVVTLSKPYGVEELLEAVAGLLARQ